MSDLPIGTVTFLFTDIESSTHLLQQLGYQYVTVLTESRRLMRTAFQQFHGYEVDTQGDSFFVAFPCACDAVSAAVLARGCHGTCSHGDTHRRTAAARRRLHRPGCTLRGQNHECRTWRTSTHLPGDPRSCSQ